MATEHDRTRRSVSPLWATNAALQARVNRLEAENLKLYIQNVSMRFKSEAGKFRDASASKPNRNAYQREWMRKKRAVDKAAKEVPHVAMTSAERQKAYRERVKAKAAKQPIGVGGEPG